MSRRPDPPAKYDPKPSERGRGARPMPETSKKGPTRADLFKAGNQHGMDQKSTPKYKSRW